MLSHIFLLIGLAALSFFDWSSRCVPASLTLAITAAQLLILILSGALLWPAAFSGLLPAFFSLLFQIQDPSSFGLGDTWVLALIGLTEGLTKTVLILTVAGVTAGVIGMLCSLAQGSSFWKRKVAFIPYLSLATGGMVLCEMLHLTL